MILPEVSTIKKIFFVGIKGVGVAPLAIIACEAGLEVAGSDVEAEFITDNYLRKKGIEISVNFEIESVSGFFNSMDKKNCLLVTTGAHKGFDNPQSAWAKANGIPVVSQGQALSLFMEGDIFDRTFKSIAVAASHGKTTIASLLATTLKGYGCDPTYVVGTGEVFPLGSPGHYGQGEYFVAEADEYSSEPVYDRIPKFLYINPSHAIFNNIDFDHPDQFDSIEDVKNAFLQFAQNIKSGGKLLVNNDDKFLAQFKDKIEKDIKVITYGENGEPNYKINKIVPIGLSSRFNVLKNGVEYGHFELSIPGAHNAKNALAVIALLSELGFEPEKIRICLREFKGTKRRSELVGEMNNGAIVFDDYAHHPHEIKTTINSIREAYPGKNLICIFQPHTFSRTKALLTDFSSSFEEAKKTILLPIFRSARDTEKDTISKEEYENGFKGKDVIFLENFSDVVEYVGQNFASKDNIIVTFGAGDVYKIAEKLIV